MSRIKAIFIVLMLLGLSACAKLASGHNLFVPCEKTANDPRFQPLRERFFDEFGGEIDGNECAILSEHEFIFSANTAKHMEQGLWQVDTNIPFEEGKYTSERIMPGTIGRIVEFDASDGKHYALVYSHDMAHGVSMGSYDLITIEQLATQASNVKFISLISWGDNSGCLGHSSGCRPPENYVQVGPSRKWEKNMGRHVPDVSLLKVDMSRKSEIAFKVLGGSKAFQVTVKLDANGVWKAEPSRMAAQGFKRQ